MNLLKRKTLSPENLQSTFQLVTCLTKSWNPGAKYVIESDPTLQTILVGTRNDDLVCRENASQILLNISQNQDGIKALISSDFNTILSFAKDDPKVFNILNQVQSNITQSQSQQSIFFFLFFSFFFSKQETKNKCLKQIK